MELRRSSPKPGVSLPSDCSSDLEEKEISDDDDDDRNHKHRRRETQSQSVEGGAPEQVLTRPYRKRNRPFENDHPYRENNSQPSETWKNFNVGPLEKELSTKFERRRSNLATFSKGPLDLNQRTRANQSSFGDSGPGRGRAWDSISWSQNDSRFSSVDIASQMVQQGSVPPSLFSGRGMPNASNAQSASWSPYGLIPGVPNVGIDTLHPLGMQGALGPAINHPLNIGIPRQRCRDFEERGFCLRGDMCPMEHGVNRIVVEDVQSLQQFNLPGSIPNANLLGAPALPGPHSSVTTPSKMMNSKGLQRKSGKPGMADDGLGLNGAFAGPGGTPGADVYDPDEPLWTNDCPKVSTRIRALNPSAIDETDSMLDDNTSDRHPVRFSYGSDVECTLGSNVTAVGTQSTGLSVWGRIGSSNNRSEMKEKMNSSTSTLVYAENGAKEDHESPISLQVTGHQGKQINTDDNRPMFVDSFLKTRSNTGSSILKPSQKALRTLFVNGIPQDSNKREALLSHFRKFGEVIDIYIPLNSERAFVQFSKREEAEAALKAPDAVMGNRFIKLWWANRDNIQEGLNSGNNVSLNSRGVANISIPPGPLMNRGKDYLQSAAPKIGTSLASGPPLPASDQLYSGATNSPKAPPPLQKKRENLELLKELRKKQEMLDQKRNDFRRQLAKLEKQATGLKGEVMPEQAAKRHKVGTLADAIKAETPGSANPGTVVDSPGAELTLDDNRFGGNVIHYSPKTNATMLMQEPSSSKPSIKSTQPLALIGAPYINRFKLDNRPTAFKIIPPLPTGLADVAVLKEHFSAYGDILNVALEDTESNDLEAAKNCSAHISFMTRHSAERAFFNGKQWQGNNLQFMWMKSSNTRSDKSGRENLPSASKESSNVKVDLTGEDASGSQEVAAPVNGDTEKLENGDSDIINLGGEENVQIYSSERSCEEQTPKGEVL